MAVLEGQTRDRLQRWDRLEGSRRSDSIAPPQAEKRDRLPPARRTVFIRKGWKPDVQDQWRGSRHPGPYLRSGGGMHYGMLYVNAKELLATDRQCCSDISNGPH